MLLAGESGGYSFDLKVNVSRKQSTKLWFAFCSNHSPSGVFLIISPCLDRSYYSFCCDDMSWQASQCRSIEPAIRLSKRHQAGFYKPHIATISKDQCVQSCLWVVLLCSCFQTRLAVAINPLPCRELHSDCCVPKIAYDRVSNAMYALLTVANCQLSPSAVINNPTPS